MSEAKHTPTPWVYRPNEHDDWGWIRDADGNLAATARDGRVWSDQFDEYRSKKADPYEANATFIVEAVNNYESLREQLATAQAAYLQFREGYEARLAKATAALEFIADGYDNHNVNHVDFRVKAYQAALDALGRDS